MARSFGKSGDPTRIIQHILAATFVVAAVAAGRTINSNVYQGREADYFFPCVGLALLLAMSIIAADWLIKRKSISVISAIVVGLGLGLVGAWLTGYVVVQVFLDEKWQGGLTLFLAAAFCYIAITIILQTKDDFRFIIPYVEFSRESRGARPFILDTSVLIDGRIIDVVETGVCDSPLIIPSFVINELQGVADSSDRLKRNRGRRGLDVLAKLQKSDKAATQIIESELPDIAQVDHKLIHLATELSGKIVTNDFNLNKVASVQNIQVVNINNLANAVRPVVLPGERLTIRVIKPGEEYGQGVGFMEDGTMVVVEQGRDRQGQDVIIIVSSVLQTSAGRMIFGKPEDVAQSTSRRSR